MLKPQDLRPLLAAIVSAEELTRDISLQQARLAPPPLARALAQQSRQEALHAVTFRAAHGCLPGNASCPARVQRAMGAFRARLQADLDSGRLAASLLGLQCVLEGVACVALAPPPGELARLADRLVPLRSLVAHQESAHHRLGEVWVARLAPAAGPALAAAAADYAVLARELVEAGLDTLACLAADAQHYRIAMSQQLLQPWPGLREGTDAAPGNVTTAN